MKKKFISILLAAALAATLAAGCGNDNNNGNGANETPQMRETMGMEIMGTMIRQKTTALWWKKSTVLCII